MKKLTILITAAVLVVALASAAMAANTTNQSVTISVGAINEISVSGNPAAPLTVSTATAGSEPSAVNDATTTYAITTNGAGNKITGRIDTTMPTGTTLEVLLAAPTGGTATKQALSATAVDLVTGISKKAEAAKTITYTFTATVAAGVVTSTTKTVTFTVTN